MAIVEAEVLVVVDQVAAEDLEAVEVAPVLGNSKI